MLAAYLHICTYLTLPDFADSSILTRGLYPCVPLSTECIWGHPGCILMDVDYLREKGEIFELLSVCMVGMSK